MKFIWIVFTISLMVNTSVAKRSPICDNRVGSEDIGCFGDEIEQWIYNPLESNCVSTYVCRQYNLMYFDTKKQCVRECV
ncbi:uncharacterized protein Dwil_GK27131 [Drosophila willistoni]|uniref:BPTI/Kunitz inhibitor domain-containing protein n=1 Tax=Drosophila willistoni TaxID=7260 RepID=A0A0Q9WQH1_DROWI|nr:uncharacterized protein Dwil_GK27131 [Drosophila willistoni]